MDAAVYLRFVASLVLVLGLIMAALWAIRRFGPGGLVPLRTGSRRRLALVEMLPLDAKRRLVLIRRDDREHLVLLGTDGDVVVERDIAATVFELPRGTPPAPGRENPQEPPA